MEVMERRDVVPSGMDEGMCEESVFGGELQEGRARVDRRRARRERTQRTQRTQRTERTGDEEHWMGGVRKGVGVAYHVSETRQRA